MIVDAHLSKGQRASPAQVIIKSVRSEIQVYSSSSAVMISGLENAVETTFDYPSHFHIVLDVGVENGSISWIIISGEHDTRFHSLDLAATQQLQLRGEKIVHGEYDNLGVDLKNKLFLLVLTSELQPKELGAVVIRRNEVVVRLLP